MGRPQGEIQGGAVERVLKDLDEGGRPISFIVNDRHSFLGRLFVYLVAIFTGFAIYVPPNLVVIAERFVAVGQSSESSADSMIETRSALWSPSGAVCHGERMRPPVRQAQRHCDRIRLRDSTIILDPSAIGP